MVFAWAHDDIVRAILTASTALPFLLFASAGFWHFGGAWKSGTKLVSVVSLLGFGSVLYGVWTQDALSPWPILGVALQALSLFLFGWAVGTSGRKNLGLALNDNASRKLITDGPYALVRHPFYTSYIVFWIGGVAVASSIFTTASALALIALYFFTSRREDNALAGLFQDEFPAWYAATGAFFPKWR
ncbi:MAG: isoprenylcysteine carboxylmethyltransferase family protein [Sphingomonadales bacterium]|nr:isoprenylcysteine carboxylmethyltransferase family protein [Sphingomonadales bacterium]